MKTQTLKGFRDFLPADAIKRDFALRKIKEVFRKFGFDPLETPTLEYEETLRGKYGEEEKLIYAFKTKGGDEVAMKYDLTVPLARVIAQYGANGQQILPIPFKRYQIQPAFRGENTQKGRYREFLQCDADIVGVSSPLSDTEMLALIYELYKNLGLDVIIKVNDRSNLTAIEPKFLSSIDKLGKIGEGNVLMELQDKGLSSQEAVATLNKVQILKPTENLEESLELYQKMGCPKDSVVFDPILVRGLDYYTGIIMEVVLKLEPNASSLGGGGRYDKMIGKFTGIDLPSVGFSVGLDRTMEAMEEEGLLPALTTETKALVTVFSPELLVKSLELASKLRQENINTELWLENGSKLDKQLKYADAKGIPFAIIIGPDEVRNDTVTLKNLPEKSQETLSLEELIQKLS